MSHTNNNIIPLNVLSQYFGFPLNVASSHLQVSTNTLRKSYLLYGIPSWPYMRLLKLFHAIQEAPNNIKPKLNAYKRTIIFNEPIDSKVQRYIHSLALYHKNKSNRISNFLFNNHKGSIKFQINPRYANSYGNLTLPQIRNLFL